MEHYNTTKLIQKRIHYSICFSYCGYYYELHLHNLLQTFSPGFQYCELFQEFYTGDFWVKHYSCNFLLEVHNQTSFSLKILSPFSPWNDHLDMVFMSNLVSQTSHKSFIETKLILPVTLL
jgi:hypothetical protein